MAQRAETTVAECPLMSCMWACFLIYSHYACTVCQLQLRWVKGVCMFRCNLPPALFAEWPGSFTCHWGSTGVEQTPNKSLHAKLTQEKKILPQLLPGIELETFRSWVRRSTKQVILAKRFSQTIFKKTVHIWRPDFRKSLAICWSCTGACTLFLMEGKMLR